MLGLLGVVQGEAESLAFFLLDIMIGEDGRTGEGDLEGVVSTMERLVGVGVPPMSKRTFKGVFLDGVLTGVRNS
jgi:hypothetical protein